MGMSASSINALLTHMRVLRVEVTRRGELEGDVTYALTDAGQRRPGCLSKSAITSARHRSRWTNTPTGSACKVSTCHTVKAARTRRRPWTPLVGWWCVAARWAARSTPARPCTCMAQRHRQDLPGGAPGQDAGGKHLGPPCDLPEWRSRFRCSTPWCVAVETSPGTPAAARPGVRRPLGRRPGAPWSLRVVNLTLRSLELDYDSHSRLHVAPPQLKANNGIFVIDDLGRQRVSARELMNRWIVPLDRRVDYLICAPAPSSSCPLM